MRSNARCVRVIGDIKFAWRDRGFNAEVLTSVAFVAFALVWDRYRI